jgi:CxxC-x17-CxxC domain-containing protein
MDNKKILLMNFSKGRIGEDNAALLGAMMITKIQLAAMSRVDMPEVERNDFYLYVDEFQNFATESFANILSEARKYHLNLIMAHQYIEQLDEKVASAVFGNVGTLVVFRVGATDAEALVKEFTPAFTEEDLVNLPKYNFCLKLMIDGVASDPFSARGLPPLPKEEITDNESVVINLTRQKYAADRETVEQQIANWHEDDFLPPRPVPTAIPGTIVGSGSAGVSASAGRPETSAVPGTTSSYSAPASRVEHQVTARAQTGFEVDCASCGKKTRITFEPDGIRPVYCKDCLVKSKADRLNQMEARRKAKEAELARLNQKPTIINKTTTTVAPPSSQVQTQVNRGVPNRQSAPPAQQLNTRPITPKTSVVRTETKIQTQTNSVSKLVTTPISNPVVRTVEVSPSPAEPIVESGPSLSLSDLGKRPALDFKGREIKESDERPPKVNNSTEGEEVTLYEG